MSEPVVVVDEVDPGVLLVRLNRPERLNALTPEVFDVLGALNARIARDKSVHAMVISGSGRGFCAGMDLTIVEELGQLPLDVMLERQEAMSRCVTDLTRLPIPVIAAVNGPASGAGFALALAADIRLASEAARFNAGFVKIGLSGGDLGTSWLLPRVVGLGRAMDLLLTGRFLDAPEAQSMGLVSRLHHSQDLIDEAIKLAQEIADGSPQALRLTKQCLYGTGSIGSLESALAVEDRTQVITLNTDWTRAAVRRVKRRLEERSSKPVGD